MRAALVRGKRKRNFLYLHSNQLSLQRMQLYHYSPLPQQPSRCLAHSSYEINKNFTFILFSFFGAAINGSCIFLNFKIFIVKYSFTLLCLIYLARDLDLIDLSIFYFNVIDSCSYIYSFLFSLFVFIFLSLFMFLKVAQLTEISNQKVLFLFACMYLMPQIFF